MRKILFLAGLWLAFAGWSRGAEPLTLNLTDGASWTGEILKADDNGVMFKATGDVYTNLPWGRFSQGTLKQLAQYAKLRPFVVDFIEPDVSQRPPKPEIKVNPVTRLKRPTSPSVLGGLGRSSVGLVILLVLYLANLYAAFEVAIFRARPLAQVIGLSALLPIIGPVIFLSMATKIEKPAETAEDAGAEGAVPGSKPGEEIRIVDASWKQEEKDKKPEAQVFARGKFTFNKRFIETKFAGFIGELKGDGKQFALSVRTPKETFAVKRILQVGATELILETAERGTVTVPLSDLQEMKLTPHAA